MKTFAVEFEGALNVQAENEQDAKRVAYALLAEKLKDAVWHMDITDVEEVTE